MRFTHRKGRRRGQVEKRSREQLREAKAASEAKQLQVQLLATYEGPMAVAQARIGKGQAIEAARSQQLPLLTAHAAVMPSTQPLVG